MDESHRACNRKVDGGMITIKRANIGWMEQNGKEQGLRTRLGHKLVVKKVNQVLQLVVEREQRLYKEVVVTGKRFSTGGDRCNLTGCINDGGREVAELSSINSRDAEQSKVEELQQL